MDYRILFKILLPSILIFMISILVTLIGIIRDQEILINLLITNQELKERPSNEKIDNNNFYINKNMTQVELLQKVNLISRQESIRHHELLDFKDQLRHISKELALELESTTALDHKFITNLLKLVEALTRENTRLQNELLESAGQYEGYDF